MLNKSKIPVLLPLIFLVFQAAILNGKELYPVVHKGKVAYIDNNGNINIDKKLETPYEKAAIEVFGKKYYTYLFPDWAYFSEGKASFMQTWGWWFIRMGKEYGVIDERGEVIVRPQDFIIWSFKNGIAKTQILLKTWYYTYGEEFSFVDENGFVFKQKYDSTKFVSSGHNFQLEQDNESWYMINTYMYAGDFSDNYAIVLLNNDSETDRRSIYNFINKKGDLLSESGFDDVKSFSEGKAAVLLDSLWGVINGSGELIVTPKYYHLWSYRNGLARFFDGKNYGFIDSKGEKRFPQMFASANDFSDGFALIQHKVNEFNFIDTNGNYIRLDFVSDRRNISNEGFAAAGNFSSGLAPVMIDGRWGYLNTKGELAIPAIYDFAQDFRSGFAQVWSGAKSMLINVNGDVIWTYKFD